MPASSNLRADARRNVELIRAAAVEVFRERGLSAPLEDVASAARVSKATIFNRFGGRLGLIDSVIDAVVAAELLSTIDDARSIGGIGMRVRAYVRALRDLQYSLPAVNDVLLQEFPESEPLMALCRAGDAFHAELVTEGHAAGILAPGMTAGDFQALAMDNATALKHGRFRPSREEYDRRTGFVLGGICRSPNSDAQ
ncbi:TetR/AcrR family transcriptional regulator [Brachybacterium saurashtrense]|uniref:TetR/AcrR family transcriptional regulator n=1 Tax=Brachybacterium saurashtrense TaxID=556288 RepID=A0A345YRK1_9MICO|nr:helix-turn-helix domain-containing protein [Brachybacterium saurashtrense]AXK46553.1 TetR/AcrR family transcriptional regulator [Brachybacterium saurashtrense]RRR24294.1 TetR/AcrR family transcriptional regulator [Brachybacterium saurashtrense]